MAYGIGVSMMSLIVYGGGIGGSMVWHRWKYGVA